MVQKSLNQVLAERLAELMLARDISANQLGKKANISPRTVGNYLAEPEYTAKGRERSAKLAEVEALAEVLGVPALALLMDKEARAVLATHLVAELATVAQASEADRRKAEQVINFPERRERATRLVTSPRILEERERKRKLRDEGAA